MDLCEHMSAVTVSSVKQWQHYQTIDSTNLAAFTLPAQSRCIVSEQCGREARNTYDNQRERTNSWAWSYGKKLGK